MDAVAVGYDTDIDREKIPLNSYDYYTPTEDGIYYSRPAYLVNKTVVGSALCLFIVEVSLLRCVSTTSRHFHNNNRSQCNIHYDFCQVDI